MKRTPCVNCGTPTPHGQPCPRCHTGGLTHQDDEYRRNKRIVRANATHCHICGKPFKRGDRITVDHIKALANGGTHQLDNLAPAHAKCNSEKGAL